MKEKQIHIYVIALILAGPIVTLIAKQVNTFDFVYYIFPVTINSIDLRVNPELSRELRIAEMIFPLFNIKIIVFGIIAFIKLIIGTVDKAFLKRFYIMTILIISIRQILIPFYYETVGQYYYFGLLGNLLWIIILVWIIKKRTHNNVYAQLVRKKIEQMKKVIFGLLIGIFSLGAIFILTIAFVFGDPCTNLIVDIQISPDKKYQAVTFTRDCGATTGFSTQVSILKATDTFDKTDEKGNTLIMSDKIGDGLIDENGGAKIKTIWTDANKLEILYDIRTETSKRETEYKNIKVEYGKITD